MKRSDVFCLGQELGEGAYGKVRVGEVEPGKKKVAIKAVSLQSSYIKESALCDYLSDLSGEKYKENLINSRYVNKCVNYNNLNREIYMDLGVCLSKLIKDPSIGYSQRDKWILEAKQGIEYMHSRLLIHGDIKPPNMIIVSGQTERGQSTRYGSLKLIDYGISEIYPVKAPYCYYTLYYRPLEMLLSEEFQRDSTMFLRPDSDYWALGASAFEILTGNLMFKDVTNIVKVLGYSSYLERYKPLSTRNVWINKRWKGKANLFTGGPKKPIINLTKGEKTKWDRILRRWLNYDPKRRIYNPETGGEDGKIRFSIPDNTLYTANKDTSFPHVRDFLIKNYMPQGFSNLSIFLALEIYKRYRNIHRENREGIYYSCLYIASQLDIVPHKFNEEKYIPTISHILSTIDNKVMKNFLYLHFKKFKAGLIYNMDLLLTDQIEKVFMFLLYTIYPTLKLTEYKNSDIFNAVILYAIDYALKSRIDFFERNKRFLDIFITKFPQLKNVTDKLSEIVYNSINGDTDSFAKYTKSIGVDPKVFSNVVTYKDIFIISIKDKFGDLSGEILSGYKDLKDLISRHNQMVSRIVRNPILAFKTNRVKEFDETIRKYINRYPREVANKYMEMRRNYIRKKNTTLFR